MEQICDVSSAHRLDGSCACILLASDVYVELKKCDVCDSIDLNVCNVCSSVYCYDCVKVCCDENDSSE